jgi:hypothetical protein
MKKILLLFLFITIPVITFSQNERTIKKNVINGVKSQLLIQSSYRLHNYIFNDSIEMRGFEKKYEEFEYIYPIYESIMIFECLNIHNQIFINKRYVYVDKNYNYIGTFRHKQSLMSLIYREMSKNQ